MSRADLHLLPAARLPLAGSPTRETWWILVPVLALGLGILEYVRRSLRGGRVGMRRGWIGWMHFERRSSPVVFWILIGLYTFTGAGLAIGAALGLLKLFGPWPGARTNS